MLAAPTGSKHQHLFVYRLKVAGEEDILDFKMLDVGSVAKDKSDWPVKRKNLWTDESIFEVFR